MLKKLQFSRGVRSHRNWWISLMATLSFCSVALSATSVFAQPADGNRPQTAPLQNTLAGSLIEGTKVGIKVVAVRDNAVAADEFTKPDVGNKFVSIQIVVDNTKGKEEWEVKPVKYKLKDTEGGVYETENLSFGSGVTQPTLKAGKLDAGDLVKGWITFQVGVTLNISSLKIRYEDTDFMANTTVKSGWIALSAAGKDREQRSH